MQNVLHCICFGPHRLWLILELFSSLRTEFSLSLDSEIPSSRSLAFSWEKGELGISSFIAVVYVFFFLSGVNNRKDDTYRDHEDLKNLWTAIYFCTNRKISPNDWSCKLFYRVVYSNNFFGNPDNENIPQLKISHTISIDGNEFSFSRQNSLRSINL